MIAERAASFDQRADTSPPEDFVRTDSYAVAPLQNLGRGRSPRPIGSLHSSRFDDDQLATIAGEDRCLLPLRERLFGLTIPHVADMPALFGVPLRVLHVGAPVTFAPVAATRRATIVRLAVQKIERMS